VSTAPGWLQSVAGILAGTRKLAAYDRRHGKTSAALAMRRQRIETLAQLDELLPRLEPGVAMDGDMIAAHAERFGDKDNPADVFGMQAYARDLEGLRRIRAALGAVVAADAAAPLPSAHKRALHHLAGTLAGCVAFGEIGRPALSAVDPVIVLMQSICAAAGMRLSTDACRKALAEALDLR
jgi:hypothetical protein